MERVGTNRFYTQFKTTYTFNVKPTKIPMVLITEREKYLQISRDSGFDGA